tara:strand:- start:893 stop:4525 length:3633 start_codon:yes stop_codon:yes gene_type:complete
MVNGTNLKKFLKTFFILILIFNAKHTFSQERYFSYQCLDNKIDPQLIINQFEIDTYAFAEMKIYQPILYDLKNIRYCYEKVKNEEKYFQIFDTLIDIGIISKETYLNIEYKDFFSKEDWNKIFYNYVLTKGILFGKNNDKKIFPKKKIDLQNIFRLIDILNLEKAKNFNDIVQIIFYSYLEYDYDLDGVSILKVLNENLEFAKNKNFFESYVILSRIKIEMLQRNNLETKCENFHNIELKEITNKYLNTKYRQYLKEDSRIIEVNKEINLAYQKTFLCLPLSMEIAKNYSNLIENLLLKKNSSKLELELKNANLKALTFQYDNYHALGDKENYNFYVKKFRKLVDEYQVSPFKKIEFELDIINKEDEANLYIKEKKIIDIIKNLSEIMYADFVKIEYASDALVFNFEKKKLELLAYRAYSQILLQTGRKLQAYEILKDQIDFYESLRDKNDYEVLILDDKLKEYVDTNQILPDLYHQILNLLAYLKDFSNFKKFSLNAFSLCEKLNDDGVHKDCYRVHLAYLKGVVTFERNEIDKERSIQIINAVDYYRKQFLLMDEYDLYSDFAKARFENEYLFGTLFGIMWTEALSSKKIIEFEHRAKNTSYYYICENDWQSRYLQNSEILGNPYASPELGIMTIQLACLIENGRKNNLMDAKEEQRYIKYLNDYLDRYQKQTETVKFKYLDTAGGTNNYIFQVSGMYAFIDEFTSLKEKQKQKLRSRLFESLQYEQAKFSIKTKKNFLEKLIPSKLDLKLKERKKLKTTYNNLVSAIILSTENNKTILINEKKQIENKINDIDNFISKKYKNFSNINKIKIYSVDEIQKSLNKNEAMIYLINEFFHQAFVITKNEFHLISDYSIGRERTKKVMDLNRKNITDEIDSRLTQNINALFFNTYFKEVYKKIKNKDKLIFVADKYYSNFPFDTMVINNPEMNTNNIDKIDHNIKPRYLVQDFEISYLPNIETFVQVSSNNKINISKNSKFLGIGDPILKLQSKKEKKITEVKFLRTGNIEDTNSIFSNYDELPFTKDELTEMSKIFAKSNLLIGKDADEKKIKNLDLTDYDVISFATHAEVFGNFSEYNEPFLVLSPPKNSTIENDGLLTTSEISELNLDSDLVILSACNTSSKKDEYAEGYSGLVASFFSAGARSIISTYWPVEDKAGYILMTETIEKSVNDQVSISEALKKTKIEFIEGKYGEEYKKPFYWAPYVYLGL